MRHFLCFALTIILIPAFFLSSAAFADPYEDTVDLFKKSPEVLPFFQNSYAYAVFPTIGKGGYIVGGAYGEGKVFRNKVPAGMSNIYKATIGFQFGGQAFSEIIFLQDKRAYDEFIRGNIEGDLMVSVVLITAGAHVKFGTEGVTAGAGAGPATGGHAKTDYRKGIAVFIHTKGGLMFESAIGAHTYEFKADKKNRQKN